MNDETKNMNNQTKYLESIDWDIEPERDLWPDIHSNIRFAGKPKLDDDINKADTLTLQARSDAQSAVSSKSSTIARYWLPMSMAACLMLALGSFIMSSMSFQRSQDAYQLQANYIEYQKNQINLIEQQHAKVRAQFTSLLNGELGPISPATVAEAQAVLMVIDNASLELKEAILTQPTKGNYSSMLARTYQQELKLLNKIKAANGLSI